MSDRVVREFPRALIDRLDRLERRLRAINLRAWPGAVRTAEGDDIDPATPAALWDVLEVNVAPGRWIVLGDVDIVAGSGATTGDPLRPSIQVRLGAFDAATGEPCHPVSDLVTRIWTETLTAATRLPVSLSGDLRCDTETVIKLQTQNTEGGSYTAVSPRLKALPV